jgi:hypothetical protein
MSETGTLEKIRRLAERRQALWAKMSSLTTADRAAIVRLTGELEALWEQHRVELTRRRVGAGRQPERPATAPTRKRTAA